MDSDMRILSFDPLIPPELLQTEHPLTEISRQTVLKARGEVISLVNGTDERQRLLVIVGPCSIHDSSIALEYCDRLMLWKQKLQDELLIVMRCYLEVPTANTAWKGFIKDPDIDDRYNLNKGVRRARELFSDIAGKGMPIATEILDTISTLYLTDHLSFGEVGARTTESEVHRQLASGSWFPVGFKNGTDGSLGIAVDAIKAARNPHHFLSVGRQGLALIARTVGNDDCFVILRGYLRGSLISEGIADVKEALKRAGLRDRLMLDCSDGTLIPEYKNQARHAADLVASGDSGIIGVILKSNIHEGSQIVPREGKAGLKYGVSITDPCLSWEDTESILEALADAVRKRRDLIRTDGNSKSSAAARAKALAAKSAYAASSAADDGFLLSGEDLVMKDVDENGWLRTPLGQLTPPRGRTRFNTKRTTNMSMFGEILTRKDFEGIFISIPKCPDSIRVQAINPKALESLSRSDRRDILKSLSAITTKICVLNAAGKHLTKKHRFHTQFSDVTLATMISVTVALRGGHSRLFTELVGLAPPDTINELRPFCKPPFLTLNDIPYIVHTAARNIVHHHGRSPDPPRTAREIGDIVAFLLQHTEDMNEQNRNALSQLFHKMLVNWPDDRDRGAQIGLTMAGIRKYVLQGKEDFSKRLNMGMVILDTIFGGLTGVPVAGAVPAALHAGAGAIYRRIGEEKLRKWEKLNDHFNNLYHSTIDCPIFLDGHIEANDDEGNITQVKINVEEFRESANKVLVWNAGTI